MKSKLHRFSAIGLLLVALGFWQCAKYEVPPKPEPSPFNAILEGDKNSFPAAGATVNILVDAGANGWWIVVPDDKKSWLSITKIYGAGNFKVPVTVRPNTTKKARTVEVVVNSSYGLPSIKLEIKQEG
jgi:hypothetical protein